MSKGIVGLLMAAFVALLVSGCGGGGGGEQVTASSISKAQFVKQADAACEKNRKQIETGLSAYFGGLSGEESQAKKEARLSEAVETIVTPKLQKELAEIRALGAPEDDRDKVEAIVDAIGEAVSKLEEDPVQIESSTQIFADAQKLAKEYGLTVCGRG